METVYGAQIFCRAAVLALAEAAVFYDYRYYKIPNRLVVWGFAAAITGKILLTVFLGMDALELFKIPVNAVVILLMLLPLYFFHAVGGGDIKLLAVAGGLLGALEGIQISVTALMVSALYGVPVMVKRRGKGRHKIHFSYAVFVAVIISILRTQIIF